MDYSFFDGLLDSVFVIGEDRGILYCNEAAAKLCESSVRRLAKGKPIYDVIEFSDPALFTMPSGVLGRDQAAPYAEIRYKLKAGKEGKIQVAIQPFSEPSGDKRWAIMLRDVTIEEVLHAKHHKQLEEKEVFIRQLQEAQAQLENYSRNLEQMVEDRTQQVKRANSMLSAIMNSLGQGFFVFDEKGLCGDVYTKACEDILESVPAQRSVWDVLRVPVNELETFHMWLKAIYGEQLPFETLKDLGPSYFQHSQDRNVKLDYFPLRNESQKISNVVVVATDKTSEYLANRALEKEKKYAKMVVKLVTSKKQFVQFLESAHSGILELKKHTLDKSVELDHGYVFRVLHTIEGEAATYSASGIWQVSRDVQEVIEPLKRGEAVDVQEIRQKLTSRLGDLDSMYNSFLKENHELFAMVGVGAGDKIELRPQDIEGVVQKMLSRGVRADICQEVSDALLREPLENSFRHYGDVVASVAEKLCKKLKPLELHGFELRVHASRYQELFSTFIHAFRNAVDHGIEPSEEREMMGKAPEGHIRATAESFAHKGGQWIRLKIEDDGGGISVEKIRAKMQSGPGGSKVQGMTDFEVMQQVFASGLSTKAEVGEFSGRGIGLNAVKIEAEQLGGRAWVESELGRGTKLIVEVPDLPRLAQQMAAA